MQTSMCQEVQRSLPLGITNVHLQGGIGTPKGVCVCVPSNPPQKGALAASNKDLAQGSFFGTLNGNHQGDVSTWRGRLC